MHHLTFAAALLGLVLVAPAHAERAIFLLAGQSNAAGMGREPAPYYPHADQISVYRNSGEWGPGREPVDEPEGQVDAVSRDAAGGVGVGMAFADHLLELRPEIAEVGLVPCAKGGSTLARWAPHWSRASLYGSCVARALEAAGEGYIAGVLWWQGEDETERTAATYGRDFAAMARALRVDLGDVRLPIAYAVIRGATKVTAVVRFQQVSIADGPAIMVSTDQVEYPDGWHPDTAGYVEIGRRFAEALAPQLRDPSHAKGAP